MKGIRRHGNGWEAFIRVNGELYTQQYPRETPFKEMRDWRDEIRRKHKTARPSKGTFAADVELYLSAVRSMTTYHDRANEIRAWLPMFASRRRSAIEPVEIRAVMERWLVPPDRCVECGGSVALPERAAAPLPRCAKCGAHGGPGYAAQTVRNRRTALMHLWHTLDGKSAPNPVRDAPPPRRDDPEPRGLPYDVVIGIIDRMPDRGRADRHGKRPGISLTKTRLRVMAWTGIPPAQIMELTPRDLHLDEAYVIVQGRRKGRGTKARRHELTTEGVAALRAFDLANAYGRFSTSAAYKSFQVACRHLGLEGLRPYDLRHSFLTAVYAATGDLQATATAGDHSTLDLTRRYTLAASDARLTSAIAQFQIYTSRQLSANSAANRDGQICTSVNLPGVKAG